MAGMKILALRFTILYTKSPYQMSQNYFWKTIPNCIKIKMIERQRVEFQIFPINLKLNKKISFPSEILSLFHIFLPVKHSCLLNIRTVVPLYRSLKTIFPCCVVICWHNNVRSHDTRYIRWNSIKVWKQDT